MSHHFAQFHKEKKRLLTDNINLRRDLKRSKKSKEKLKMKLKATELARKAGEEVIRGMVEMNPTAKMLFENELINSRRKQEAQTYTQEIKNSHLR